MLGGDIVTKEQVLELFKMYSDNVYRFAISYTGSVELMYDRDGNYVSNMMNIRGEQPWHYIAMDAEGVPTGNIYYDEEYATSFFVSLHNAQ